MTEVDISDIFDAVGPVDFVAERHYLLWTVTATRWLDKGRTHGLHIKVRRFRLQAAIDEVTVLVTKAGNDWEEIKEVWRR